MSSEMPRALNYKLNLVACVNSEMLVEAEPLSSSEEPNVAGGLGFLEFPEVPEYYLGYDGLINRGYGIPIVSFGNVGPGVRDVRIYQNIREDTTFEGRYYLSAEKERMDGLMKDRGFKYVSNGKISIPGSPLPITLTVLTKPEKLEDKLVVSSIDDVPF